ncbi:protein of unknown function [Bradyrhizobium vignae]|uniref:Uncharacterized protein n=1 Tax=Bradyrhizobium vignae TaxID=1549949 RepID=A0A2U3PS70_9BRAD|nr:protein of unknown function [Bradyrhizobium vignae]
MKPLASICKRGLLRAMGTRVNARPRGNPESLRGKILDCFHASIAAPIRGS